MNSFELFELFEYLKEELFYNSKLTRPKLTRVDDGTHGGITYQSLIVDIVNNTLKAQVIRGELGNGYVKIWNPLKPELEIRWDTITLFQLFENNKMIKVVFSEWIDTAQLNTITGCAEVFEKIKTSLEL